MTCTYSTYTSPVFVRRYVPLKRKREYVYMKKGETRQWDIAGWLEDIGRFTFLAA